MNSNRITVILFTSLVNLVTLFLITVDQGLAFRLDINQVVANVLIFGTLTPLFIILNIWIIERNGESQSFTNVERNQP